MMTKLTAGAALFSSFLALAVPPAQGPAARSLLIYFVDVEGGQSTLIVTPTGESMLVDAGFAGADGVWSTGGNGQPMTLSSPGDPARARDAQRIAAAARDAGIRKVDDLVITHFHPDHDAGVTE